MDASNSNSTFEFSGWQLDGRTVRLGYRLSGAVWPDTTFEEVIQLPQALPVPDAADSAIRAALDVVHFTFGVSYYKAACSLKIVAPPVSEPVAVFLDTLYTEGMGEFYFRNGINPAGRVHFARSRKSAARARYQPSANERVLVLVGGGKDSVVAREVLRHAGIECDALSLGSARWIETSAAAMGVSHHVIRRTIDPKLFALNALGALNGHVPISACIAAISQLVAVSGGYSAVIAANERSADEGNTSWNGFEINHQWSKSFRFEQAFRALTEQLIDGAPLYLSILRPLSELTIARLFAGHAQYHAAVSSCNKNFRVHEPRPDDRWCGHCPKCVFVYLMVAAQASPEILARVFGGDFLADPGNLQLLADLTGVGGIKPFECVGTPTECRAALGHLHQSGRLPATAAAWYERVVHATPEEERADWGAAMTPAKYPFPEVWQARLDAYLRAH